VLGLLPVVALPAPAARTVEGRVQRVVDGDSLWLEPADGAAPIELRLQGIDAPEICQAHGAAAKAALAELVSDQPVRVRLEGPDTHGRQLGTLFVGERNINKRLVQDGHAWSARYKWDRGPYVADERMAKALSRGFHRESGAVMPRDFRRAHGPCQDAAPAAAAAVATAAAPAPVAAMPYRCDGRTRCTQMRSCAEATWFLQHCPGVEMDGDRDGVPCEAQWCGAGR
jgi:endonuclease YncB( thermonuclease family)